MIELLMRHKSVSHSNIKLDDNYIILFLFMVSYNTLGRDGKKLSSRGVSTYIYIDTIRLLIDCVSEDDEFDIRDILCHL